MESSPPVRKVKRIIFKFGKTMESASGSNEQDDASSTSKENKEKRRRRDSSQLNEAKTYKMASQPIEDCNSNEPLVLTGTACKGGIAPAIGAVYIGVSKSAYYFRVALPGVKEDPDSFSCEIKQNGQVHIRGVTLTGGEIVSRHSRTFKMKIQNQRPPGPFSIFFRLPGHVDPRLPALNFRCDGIFEVVVGKLFSAAVIRHPLTWPAME